MRLLLRFFGFLFATATLLGIVGAAAVGVFVWQQAQDLPDHEALEKYEPPIMTRLHAVDGSLIAEYANERRLFLPIQAVPKQVIQAFMAAEDKNFHRHTGIDESGLVRAFVGNLAQSRRLQGGSTITQQIAKNLLVGDELTYARKIREMIVASRMERALSKDEMLELYLNSIYLGRGSWGIELAAQAYFGKSADALAPMEGALLAGLTKGPNYLNPDRHPARARERLAYVLSRMEEDGVATVGLPQSRSFERRKARSALFTASFQRYFTATHETT